jgi:hypothetical protein
LRVSSLCKNECGRYPPKIRVCGHLTDWHLARFPEYLGTQASEQNINKRRKRREASKNVQKLSAYFAPIQPSLQSQGEVELESQTVQCTVCTETFECDNGSTSSVLYDTCSTAASDHDAGDVFDCELDLEIVSEATIGAESSVFGSMVYPKMPFSTFKLNPKIRTSKHQRGYITITFSISSMSTRMPECN